MTIFVQQRQKIWNQGEARRFIRLPQRPIFRIERRQDVHARTNGTVQKIVVTGERDQTTADSFTESRAWLNTFYTTNTFFGIYQGIRTSINEIHEASTADLRKYPSGLMKRDVTATTDMLWNMRSGTIDMKAWTTRLEALVAIGRMIQ